MSFPTGLNFEYVSGCLTVRATGREVVERKTSSIKAIAHAIEAQPTNAVLIDLRELVGPYTFMDRYQLGELIARHLSKTPIGVLSHEEQTDRQHISQLVATNRGAKLETFTDPATAFAWLQKYATPAQ